MGSCQLYFNGIYLKNKKFNSAIFLIFSSFVSAQRFDILSGDLKSLKDISEYNVTFDYSNLVVNGFDSEEAYLKDKMGKRDHIEGKAEKFKENWYSDRENKYEPKFINYFNHRFENKEVKVAKNIEAKYTMNVKTTWIYPGYVLGKVEPPKLSAIITVFETENPKNILLKIEFEKLIGLAYELNSDQGYRILELMKNQQKTLQYN